ncbi:MAG: cysteine dioxygenase type [Solirubrobacterales bacterium]|jgi:predicted metal-dependent enzyme (double-stranded beta helix superfamily)|nr:cysteine dioxygenase type [Solirubrobacterales bacterium]
MTQPRTTAELQDIVTGLVAHPRLWRDGVVFDADERQCSLIARTETVEIWAVAWMPGQDTGFHDHDASAAAIAVAEGAIVDERMALSDATIRARHEAGAVFTVGAGEIHRARHAGEGPAISIHAYSPPLHRMGTYAVGVGGRLLRQPVGGDQTLTAD